ncbi:MAG: MtaA/CmuA family methyltransferase [Verrucomicrobiae bacterium]|nr:MtaA/CmuA family methyltransferase [Verrucomicrobiae bacterium]
MTPREHFLRALQRQPVPRPAVGSATSLATADLMDEVGASFPEAHLDAEKMALLAGAGRTLLGYDNVMPLFSVWHESAALGCEVEWGEKHRMPGCRTPLCGSLRDEIRIPRDLLKRPGCAVPLRALALLKRRFGDDAAVVGKVFGPWTLGYHVFGVETFLLATLEEPDAVRRALKTLLEVTVQFGRAQIEAGADALTLADHATRDLCSPKAYEGFLREIHHELKERLRGPIVLHVCGDTSDRIGMIRTTGMDCFHFDSKVPASKARALAGDAIALMGGTSNLAVIRKGAPEIFAADVREKLRHRIEILGPECAVPLDAPWRNLKAFADEARRQPLPV